MPKKYRVLSGLEVIRIFETLGFEKISQKGSHAKLSGTTPENERQVLVIPLHKELSTGTTRAIYSQALRYVDESELRPYFIAVE